MNNSKQPKMDLQKNASSSHQMLMKDPKLTIIPNTAIYKFMRGFMCFLLVSLSILYLLFSCSYAIKYRPLVFDNILTETIKGTIKGTNGEYIQWIATIPTGLVSRTVSIICVVMFLIFGVYTLLFSFYTACKKYKFIQPWYFILLSAMSCVGGLIAIFLSNKFYLVNKFTGLEDCPIQPAVSNDCSAALSSDEIYAYDLCRAVESFCIDENSSMSAYYKKAIIVTVASFIVSVFSFIYGVILFRLKMKYSRKLALINEKNDLSEKIKTDIELINSKSICQYENRDISTSSDSKNSPNTISTKENTNATNSTKSLYSHNITNSTGTIQPYQFEPKALPVGIVVTTTTSKQCHVSHPGFINQFDSNNNVNCYNSIQSNSLNHPAQRLNRIFNHQHHQHQHHQHHHHHHHHHNHVSGQNRHHHVHF